jgi:hypothetical protein
LKWENVNGQEVVVEAMPTYVWSPRELFSRHDDFSPESINHGLLISKVDNEKRFITANGDYAPFSIIFKGLNDVFDSLNVIPGVSVPRKPELLAPRVGLLKTLMEITIRIYKCSSLSQVIGGEVLTLGIKPDGTYL